MGSKNSNPFRLIVVSILAFLAWLVFILVYALAWSTDFSLFQNVIVFIVSLLITGVLIGLMWVIWGFKLAGWSSDSWRRKTNNL